LSRAASLGAAAILAAGTLKRVTVDVPEWGGKVTVRELTLAERIDMATVGEDGNAHLAAWLVVTAATDAAGEPLFAMPAREAAIGTLMTKSAVPVGRLAEAVMRISGLTASPEDAEKN